MINALLVFSALLVGQLPAKEEGVPQYLQNISVTLTAGGAQGSGVIKIRNGVSYVWTAGHVIQHLRHVRTVLDPITGQDRKLIEFDDVTVTKELYQDGRSVGKVEVLAEVLRYSDPEDGDDLALLRVRKSGVTSNDSAVFNDSKEIPSVGVKLWHCGSLLGQSGSNSVTEGIESQVGRVLFKRVFDQTSCNAFPGSSGGGVYLKNGKYIGMLVRGAGETYNLIVPLRRMRAWADKVGVAFAMDDSIQVPDDKTLLSKPIEDAPLVLEKAKERAAAAKEYPTWIYIKPTE